MFPNSAQIFHFQNLVEGMDVNTFKGLRQFGSWPMVILSMAFSSVPEPGQNVPEWCKRERCVTMPTLEENKCCNRVAHRCISRTNLLLMGEIGGLSQAVVFQQSEHDTSQLIICTEIMCLHDCKYFVLFVHIFVLPVLYFVCILFVKDSYPM